MSEKFKAEIIKRLTGKDQRSRMVEGKKKKSARTVEAAHHRYETHTERRQKAVEMWVDGYSMGAIVKHVGAGMSTVSRWINRFEDYGQTGAEQ